ncbi:hypothetical protein LCGC14_3159040, partial [marine sediment metagenome]
DIKVLGCVELVSGAIREAAGMGR